MKLFCVQLPIVLNKQFCGVIDIVDLEKLVWDVNESQSNRKGRTFTTTRLSNTDEHWDSCIHAREVIIEQVSCFEMTSAALHMLGSSS